MSLDRMAQAPPSQEKDLGCPQDSPPTRRQISILYSSKNYVVVEKPPDLLLNSNDRTCCTVHTQLCSLLPHLADDSLRHSFRYPHRLDFATSGILCVALNKAAARWAVQAFTSHRTEKYYLGLVRGHVRDNVAIDLSVGQDGRPERSHMMCAATAGRSFCVSPRTATTRLLVLQRGLYDGREATKVLLKPFTGRRHQLRVHCAEIGHTIVGDYTYSDGQDRAPHRMFLHAFRLVVPTEEEVVDVSTSDPFSEQEPENCWQPETTVCELDYAFAQFKNDDSFVAWNENNVSS